MTDCGHRKGSRDFYFRLEHAVGEAFAHDPCVGRIDLYAVLDAVPDPPPGCAPPPDSESADFYLCDGRDEAFNCPLQPMTIRSKLSTVAVKLNSLNRHMLDREFGKGSG